MEPIDMETIDMETIGMETIDMETIGMETVGMETIDMENETTDITAAMAANVLLFGLMGKIFYSYPDFEWIHGLITEGVFEDIPGAGLIPETSGGQDLLLQWSKENSGGLSKELFSDLEVDYVRLFISGNDSVQAPPWESVFVNADPTLFQGSTMHVRSWYRRFGLEAENLHHEPDDHIGLEFAFISHLCSIALDYANTSDEVMFNKTVADLTEFTTHHVFRWGLRWCDLVIEKAKTKFYRGAALFSKGILINLAATLKVDIKTSVYR